MQIKVELVGENGTGKSILLEALVVAYGFNAEGGTKNYSFSTYDSHSRFYEKHEIMYSYGKLKNCRNGLKSSFDKN